MKRFAFTLSEILVTLSIVGVVAILTVPNITKNIYTKTDIATLQSTLKNLGDSVKAMMVNERVTRISDSTLEDSAMAGFYNKYLKINKLCDFAKDCFAEKYTSIYGDEFLFVEMADSDVSVNDISPIATLPSGVSLLFANKNEDFVKAVDLFKDTAGNFLNVFVVDINGPKPPNVIGIDMFSYTMDERGNVGYFRATPEDVYAVNDIREVCRTGEDYGLSCAYLLQTDNWDPKVITKKYPDEEVGE